MHNTNIAQQKISGGSIGVSKFFCQSICNPRLLDLNHYLDHSEQPTMGNSRCSIYERTDSHFDQPHFHGIYAGHGF
jgi:hypothetical protein